MIHTKKPNHSRMSVVLGSAALTMFGKHNFGEYLTYKNSSLNCYPQQSLSIIIGDSYHTYFISNIHSKQVFHVPSGANKQEGAIGLLAMSHFELSSTF